MTAYRISIVDKDGKTHTEIFSRYDESYPPFAVALDYLKQWDGNCQKITIEAGEMEEVFKPASGGSVQRVTEHEVCTCGHEKILHREDICCGSRDMRVCSCPRFKQRGVKPVDP